MGKRNDWFSLSLSSSFLVFEFFSLLLLLLNETKEDKRRGRESFALSLCVPRTKNILKISHKGQKRRKKASFQGRKYSLFSLCSLCSQGGRASSLPRRRRRHHQPSMWNTEQREKKESRTARAQAKNLDIWWREEVLLGVLLIERSVFARAFVPL